jgi:FG-GAP-like repeat
VTVITPGGASASVAEDRMTYTANHDFGGIGEAGLLWRDTSGDTSIWLMNGTHVTSSVSLGNIPTNWVVAGTGFDGDGFGDILWRDTSGNTAIWFLKPGGTGVQISASAGLGNIPSTRSVVGTEDFNGDGKTSILVSCPR